MIFVTVIEPRNRRDLCQRCLRRSARPDADIGHSQRGLAYYRDVDAGAGPELVDYTGAVYNVPELGSETINLSPVVPPKPKGS